MQRLSVISLFLMFWLIVGALLLSEGKPLLAILAGLSFMTLPYFAANWVQEHHRVRVDAARKSLGRADGAMRLLLRDASIAAVAALACLGLALWAFLGF